MFNTSTIGKVTLNMNKILGFTLFCNKRVRSRKIFMGKAALRKVVFSLLLNTPANKTYCTLCMCVRMLTSV